VTVDKSPDAFRTISEVADDLDLPQHVLRFWETRFSQIRPLKRGGGRRYYRPEDIDLLRGIRHLLYGEGYTIKGVQRILKEQGPRFVMQVWRDDGIPLAAIAAQVAGTQPDATAAATAGRSASARTAPAPGGPARQPTQASPSAAGTGVMTAASHEGEGDRHSSADLDVEPVPRGILPEGVEPPQGRGGLRLMERLLGERSEHGPATALSRDDIRRLQATLFELLECKRILDQAR
jgi:DNA-binding transcriptional MerR regulator